MNQPLVSVLFITYNHKDFIRDSLTSTADQDYANLEIIVGDDGSSDGTADIVREIAAAYPAGRIIPIVDEGHLGITGNCNRVLRRCGGKYMTMFAGDDIMLPGKIARQVAWMEEDERRVTCGHDVEIFRSETNQSLGLFSSLTRFRSGRGAAMHVEHGLPFPPISQMFRMSAVPAGGFDDRLVLLSDWKFAVDVVAAGGEYGYVDGVYARYRRHENSALTLPFEQKYTDGMVNLALVESEYPALLNNAARSRRMWFLRWAISLENRGRRREARQYLRTAFRGRMWFHWKAYAVALLLWMPSTWSRRLIARQQVFPW